MDHFLKHSLKQVNKNNNDYLYTVRTNLSSLFADLLYSSQTLELSGAEAVLLLECCSLQHQMLLLSSVHLLQVLCCRVRLSV